MVEMLGFRYFFLSFLPVLFFLEVSGQYRSRVIYQGSTGRLTYVSENEDNRIPDFSQVGYQRGDKAIPELPPVAVVAPVSGDNTIHLQRVIDSLSAKPVDANGFRGMILLRPGKYELYSTLKISASGIVLRGAGEGADETSNTIFVGKGKDFSATSTVILVSGNAARGWKDEVDQTRTKVISEFVPVGARTLRVERPAGFAKGDEVIIFHPCTQRWIDHVEGGGTDVDPNWMPGEVDIVYKRQVVAVVGNQLVLDIPVYNHLDRKLSQSYVYKYNAKGIVRNVGIERLRIDIGHKGGEDEEHANYGIYFSAVQDCWAKRVAALHFVRAGFIATTADRLTIDSCQALLPISKIMGERRYNFCAGEYANNLLFSNCTASEARHAFVSNGCGTASGLVFTQGRASVNHTASESHRMWSQGLLFDQIEFRDNRKVTALALYNRGSYGIGHGWSAVHSVAWNCRVVGGRVVIQKPPGGQNYGIACGDTVDAKGPFTHGPGHIEGTGQVPAISSLYAAQLSDRRSYGLMPDAPVKLSLRAEGNKLKLNWINIATDATGYVVEASDDGVSFQRLVQLPADSQSYLIQRTRKYYRVYAVNAQGSSAYAVFKASKF